MTCDLVRPCARCTKRGIGHLCHDEPREPESTTKKAAAKSQQQQHHHNNKATVRTTAEELGGTPPDLKLQISLDNNLNNSFVTADQQQQQQQQGQDQVQENKLGLEAPAISRGVPLQLVQPTPVSGIQANALNSSSNNQCMINSYSPSFSSLLMSPRLL